MDSEQPTRAAFTTIETELRTYAGCGECDEAPGRAARSEAAMTISDSCRTYRRMRDAIEVVLPSVQSERPDVADLLRFLVKIADRACKVQVMIR